MIGSGSAHFAAGGRIEPWEPATAAASGLARPGESAAASPEVKTRSSSVVETGRSGFLTSALVVSPNCPVVTTDVDPVATALWELVTW